MAHHAEVQIELMIRVAIRGNEGLVREFLAWTISCGVHPVVPAESTIDSYQACFAWKDVRRIETWFATRSVGVATTEH
jgi:hypothetical protein